MDKKPPTRRRRTAGRFLLALVFLSCAAWLIALGVADLIHLAFRFWRPAYILAILGAAALAGTLILTDFGGEERGEEEARARLRNAEANLVSTLRTDYEQLLSEVVAGDSQTDIPLWDEENAPTNDTPDNKRSDDRLALAALWTVTHERLDLYHRIATGQARRSFITAQAAMMAGFVLLIGFTILAVRAQTTVAAVTTGSLGAVAAAFAGTLAAPSCAPKNQRHHIYVLISTSLCSSLGT